MPFDFLLDYLPAGVVITPAIGMFYIYFEGKIILIFRKVGKNPQHNGIWISTRKEAHHSLKTEIPAITDFNFEDHLTETNWLLLNDEHEDFEEAAIVLCGLVSGRDKRIGKPTAKAAQLTGQNL